MDEHPTLTWSQRVVLAMDHGQFYLRGADADADELLLLERALAMQPNAGDGSTVVVISPHQNNFEMPIDVEVFDTRPPVDDEDWQQLCEDRLEIDPRGVLQIDSTPAMCIECRVPPGRYLVQVAGRGFVNYGWPGDTAPGDVWRIRLWPEDGIDPRPAVRWHMPGYGVPADTELPPDPTPEPAEDEPRWVHVFGSGEPPRLVERSEIRSRAEERLQAEWGGNPIPRVASFGGGQDLARFDRELVVAIVDASEADARAIAVWCALAAAEHAGLSAASWARPALDALAHDQPMPPPFDGYDHIGDAFARLTADRQENDHAFTTGVSITRTRVPTLQNNPYEGPVVAGYMAVPALYSARDADPHRAAIETLHHASHTFAAQVAELHSRLKEKFFRN